MGVMGNLLCSMGSFRMENGMERELSLMEFIHNILENGKMVSDMEREKNMITIIVW